MAPLGPKSIRGKITLLASVATAVAMVLIVFIMGYTMRLMLENAIAESLSDRLEQALGEVELGDYAAAVDSSGNEIIQVIDARGNVVAESRNARGLKALDVDAGTTEVAELAFSFDEERVSEEASASNAEGEPSDADGAGDAGAAPSAEEVATPADGGDDGGDDDDDGETSGAVEPDDDRNDHDEADDDRDEPEDDAGDTRDEAVDEAGDTRDEPEDEAEDEPDDDRDEAEDEGDDDRDEAEDEAGDEQSEKARVRAQGSPSSQTKAQRNLPSQITPTVPLWSRAVAWAAETGATSETGSSGSSASSNALNSPGVSGSSGAASASTGFSDVVDARAVLGAEGPYVVQKKEATSPDGPMSIVGVASLASAARSAWQMAGLLSAIMAGVLVAVAVFAWLLTGRTLRPVEDMRAKAATITAQNLDERIDVPRSDKDLARLAETLNEMLSRIGRALDEEKRFISDASHELKSPIAATSIILDSLRAHPETLDVAHAVDDLTSENSRMASIVSDMLALTRYDEGRLAYRPEPIDLMDLVMEESLSLQARSAVELDMSGLQPVVCRADPELLAHAVRNVLDNASHYAERVVKVSCGQRVQGGQEGQEGQETRAPDEPHGAKSASSDRGAVFIRVSDDGCGIPPADRERVFGRFVCLNEGHTGSQGGTGLGLAVVASAIDAHGGSVAFTDPEIGGATVFIELPQ